MPFHARYSNGYQDKCLFFVFLKVWGFLKVFFWTRMKMKVCIFKTWSWRPCWILNFRYGIFYWIFKQFIRPLHAIFCYGYEDKCLFLFHLKFEIPCWQWFLSWGETTASKRTTFYRACAKITWWEVTNLTSFPVVRLYL